MDETVYLGFYVPGAQKWSIIGYLLVLASTGFNSLDALKNRGELFPLYPIVFLVMLFLGLVMFFYARRSGMPRVVFQNEIITIRLMSSSKLQSYSPAEIESISLHPARATLVIRQSQGSAIEIAPYGYKELKRLKAFLLAYATAHNIPLTEALYNPPLKKGGTPH